MGFAEQLAARAAEAHSHNTSSSSIRRLTPPRPRPGKIVHPQSSSHSSPPRSNTTSSAQSNSSPSLFADQLKQRRARRENSSLLSDSNRPTAIIDSNGAETDTPTKKEHTSLVPTTSYDIGEEEDEEDEYASVGFSLMDASTDDVESAADPDESYAERSIQREKGMGVESNSSITSTKRKPRQKLRPAGSISDITAPPPKGGGALTKKMQQQQQQQQQHQHQQQPREVPKTKHTEDEATQFVSKPRITYPQQEQNDSELQTILQLQLMKSQSGELHQEEGEGGNSHSIQNETTATSHNTAEDSSSTVQDNSSSKQIFGAWAQIEQLQRRVHEAERRAKEESQRAELASHELRLVKEGGSSQGRIAGGEGERAQQDEEGEGGQVEMTASVSASNEIQEEGKNHQETTPTSALGDHETVLVPTVKTDEVTNEAAPSTNQQSSTSPDDEMMRQWKKRALEAEERLAKGVERLQRAAVTQAATAAPAAHAPPQSSTAHFDEETDLIRLKNAEIDVLRSQIHRLERRIAEECERNEDLIRSSYHNNLHTGVDHHPPLVVASECSMTQSTTRSSDMDEFRLLRNEIRHLQYQLRAKSGTVRNGAGGGMGTSSTGGSTLSSLDDGQDENGYHNESHDESGDNDDDEVVMEEDENGNAVASSSWGLCCFRGRRSGYRRASQL